MVRRGMFASAPTALLEDKYSELGGDLVEQQLGFSIAFKAEIKRELQERRNRAIAEENVRIAEAKRKAELEENSKRLADADSRAALDVAAELLANEEAERVRKENERLQKELKEAEERDKEEIERLKREEKERVEAIEKAAELEIKEKDKIIEKYQKSIEEYKKAFTENQNAIELQQLCVKYIELSKENDYLLQLLKDLVQNPVDPLLIRAVMSADLESAKAAIKLGADVDALDRNSETSLHKACSDNNLQMVKFLLVCQCDVSIKNINGQTAKDLTTNKEIAQLIDNEFSREGADDKPAPAIANSPQLSREAQTNPLYIACKNGYHDVVEKILINKLDSHVTDFDYNVALQSTNNPRVMALLYTAKLLSEFSESKMKSVTFLFNFLASKISSEIVDKGVHGEYQIADKIKAELQDTLETYIKINGFDPSNLSSHLAAYYPFRGDAKDETYHGNDGTVYGARLVRDRFGSENSAYHFDGRSYIWGKAKSFPRGDRTISLWYKPDIINVNSKTDRRGTLFGYSGIHGNQSHIIGDNSTNLVLGINRALYAFPNRENNIDAYVWGKPVGIVYNHNMYQTPSTWNHLVLTSSSDYGMSMYLNGEKVTQDPRVLQTNGEITDFSIGSWVLCDTPGWSTDDPMFFGDIDEVRVYDYHLSDKEIEFLYMQPTKDTAETFSKQFDQFSELIQFIDKEKIYSHADELNPRGFSNAKNYKLLSNQSTLFGDSLFSKETSNAQSVSENLTCNLKAI